MKYSIYNFLFKNQGFSLLYNAVTDGILILDHQVAEYVEKFRYNIEALKTIHNKLFIDMIEKGMIVDDASNETENVINRWKKEDNDPTNYYLTILPTLSCNLRCWYCYEEHLEHSIMSNLVRDNIVKFINKRTEDKKLNNLHIDLFGGEPLLYFDRTVLPILEQASESCKKRGKNLILHFTTNGVLINDDILKKITALNLCQKPSFQITLDGNRRFHDATRYTVDKCPTFDLVLDNICKTLKYGMPVNCRLNYSANNIDSFVDLLDEFEKRISEKEKDLLFFDFQQVWQEGHLVNIRQKAIELADLFRKHLYKVRVEKQYNSQRCKNDSENQASINYDGLVYKCTAINITHKNNEGILNNNGDIEWNLLYKERMRIKYGNSVCKKCEIFPICHGGCSQNKLNSNGVAKCIMNKNQEQRRNVVIGRIKFLMQNQIPIELKIPE